MGFPAWFFRLGSRVFFRMGLIPQRQCLLHAFNQHLLPLGGFENAHVRHPVAGNGQELLRVVDGGVDQQAAVGIGAGALVGQQIAPGEVVGDFGGNAQGGFLRFFVEPHVLHLLDEGKMLRLRGEARVFIDLQRLDAGNTKVLELLFAGWRVHSVDRKSVV